MSLKSFHIAFVAASSTLAFLITGWCVRYAQEHGSTGYWAMAAACAAGGVGLIVYGFWFWKKITTREEDDRRRRKIIRKVPAVLVVAVVGDQAAHACNVCYGAAEGPMIDGARMGVYLLFGLVLLMQVSFAAFFITLRRRAKRHYAGLDQADDATGQHHFDGHRPPGARLP